MFLAMLMILTVMFSALTARAVSQAQIDALQESKSQLEFQAKDIQAKINALRGTGALHRPEGRAGRAVRAHPPGDRAHQPADRALRQADEEKAAELEEALKKEREQYELFGPASAPWRRTGPCRTGRIFVLQLFRASFAHRRCERYHGIRKGWKTIT
jgi:hypothetical protein